MRRKESGAPRHAPQALVHGHSVAGPSAHRLAVFIRFGILGELNEAQHCRAEFYIPGYGWIGVDPADVRKAIREENLDNHDPKLTVLKKLLFGFWEMNWVSLNAAQDVRLRGLDGDPLPWLLYPVVETGEWRLDHPDSSRINYSVTASRSEEA